MAEHAAPAGAEHATEGDAAQALEAAVLEAEAGAARDRLERPGHDRRPDEPATPPGVGEAPRWVELGDLAVDDAVEARPGLGAELEAVAQPRLEGVLHEPARHRLRVGEGAPDPLGRMRVDGFQDDVAFHSAPS